MCIFFLAQNISSKFKTIIALNRDEYYSRPTAAAQFWPPSEKGSVNNTSSGILAGRDLKGGGTWFGVNQKGCFAALTNFRDPHAQEPGKVSRGRLVTDFLQGSDSAEVYLEKVKKEPTLYNAYNLVVSDGSTTLAYNSRYSSLVKVGDGLFGLSNDQWETPWPKVSRGKRLFAKALQNPEQLQDRLIELLADRKQAEVSQLPETGVGTELEKLLSPVFIQAPGYGTVSSTVVLIDHQDQCHFKEVTYSQTGPVSSVEFTFNLLRSSTQK